MSRRTKREEKYLNKTYYFYHRQEEFVKDIVEQIDKDQASSGVCICPDEYHASIHQGRVYSY